MVKWGIWVAFFLTVFAVFDGYIALAQVAPPTAPTGVTVSVAANAQVTVSWNAASSSISIGGYYVYRNGMQVANTAGLTFTDHVTASGVYSYRVSAYDTAGTVSPQSSASANLTVSIDSTPPTAPANLIAAATTSTAALSWSASTDNVAVTGYYVYRNDVQVAALNATAYIDTGLTPGETYTYSVEAYDAAGNISLSSNMERVSMVSDLIPPTVPMNLTARVISASQINLSWQYSSDNVGVAGYYIYEGGSQIGATSSTSYSVIGLAGQTSYVFTVAAYDAAGNISAQSTSVNPMTLAPDIYPPSVPAGFVATTLSGSSIGLSWYSANDNVGVTGYDIYRDGSKIGTATTTSYIDTGLATGTLYSYNIDAYDAAGNISSQSVASAAMTLTTMPVAPAPVMAIPPIVATSTTAPSINSVPVMFEINLAFLSRGTAVTALQEFLIGHGYLGAQYATGVFGSLTQSALQKFQCAQNIVCSGTPTTTGWGKLGPKTRQAMNSSSSSVSAGAELQVLENELAALQKQR